MNLKDINKVLAAASADLSFAPTPDMRRIKAAFWTKMSDTGGMSDTVTLAAAQQTIDDKRLDKWWSLPGFTPWFQNKDEFRERLEYLADVALDSLEQVLTDPDANAGAKVASAKLVLEAASKMPKKEADAPSSRLDAMSRSELEEYVRKNLKFLTTAPTPDIVNEASDDTTKE